jgi:hypothetical protein
MISHWDDAADQALLMILNDLDHSTPVGIPEIRRIIDRIIDSGDTTPLGWIDLGASAVALARSWALLPEADLPARQQIVKLLVRKQRDYGHGNIARFGQVGLYVRMHDKVARLENLMDIGKAPENESIHDNLMDVVGYSAIGIMWSLGTFMLPLQPTVAESIPR